MENTIKLPDDLNFRNSKDFCVYLNSFPEEIDDFVFDFDDVGNVEPFGMLLIGAKIRQFREKRSNSNFTAINYSNNDYAAHMGFYKSLGLDYGKAPGEAKGSNTYLPVTKLDVSEIREESRSNIEHIVDTVERRAEAIATVLSCDNLDVKEVLTYSIREIMRNVIEHSEAESIWYAGQYWPKKDKVEIAILDEGIGIHTSLRKNRKLKFQTTSEALYLAIEPGISGKDIKAEMKRDGVYGNSGYGLFMTSRICEDGGDYVIGCGEKVLGINKKTNSVYDLSFDGTVIRMRLRPSKIKDLSSLLKTYLKEGAERSKSNNQSSVITASKSSRLLLRTEI